MFSCFGLLSRHFGFIELIYFQVIPPDEWKKCGKRISEDVKKGFTLQTVVNQSATKLPGGAFNLSFTYLQMSYDEFEETAKAKELELGLSGMSIDEIENAHWRHICSPRNYSIDNNISLFGDVQIWNLDQFTKTESNIHSTRTHHTLEVSVIFSIPILHVLF